MNIGIFGITANPPHLGHLKAIEEAANQLDEVWVTPVFKHPFNKGFIDYTQRVEMLDLMLTKSMCKNIFLKELDKEYLSSNPEKETVYSYDLLADLKNKYKHSFKLIIGEDNYKPEIWNRFYKFDNIEKEFGLIIVKDSGAHSTDIRNKLKNNESITGLVSKEVENYINKHILYKEVLKCKM